MKRKIVQIDRDRCDGCGQCVPNCAEGALRIEGGKAVLVSDSYCDGLGACLGHCPRDAIRMVEREAPDFDQEAVARRLDSGQKKMPPACPGSRVSQRGPLAEKTGLDASGSQLSHWPVQLHLVPVSAPFLKGADLLVSASCVPFAQAGFHRELLTGRSLVIACPKLDRTEPYQEKLAEIFRRNDIRSVTVAVMEVPCCQGLVRLVKQAMAQSGRDAPVNVEVTGVNGRRKAGQSTSIKESGE